MEKRIHDCELMKIEFKISVSKIKDDVIAQNPLFLNFFSFLVGKITADKRKASFALLQG